MERAFKYSFSMTSLILDKESRDLGQKDLKDKDKSKPLTFR